MMIVAAAFLLSWGSIGAAAEKIFELSTSIPTRGAAGFEKFTIDGRDYIASANFFTSAPGRTPAMETDSVVYALTRGDTGKPLFTKIQSIPTVGAHGVEFFNFQGEAYLAIPNYYGGDTVVLRWSRTPSVFEEIQRIPSDGGGSVESFIISSEDQASKDAAPRLILSIAEFNIGRSTLYALEGVFPNEKFVSWQRLTTPGVGAMATIRVNDGSSSGRLLFLAASYVSRTTGWRTKSRIFALEPDEMSGGATFSFHHDVPTVGAHDVETLMTADGRAFAFFSYDKDEASVEQNSELFEWRADEFQGGRFVSMQTVKTVGAHAAEFFKGGGAGYFLAVANLGDRRTNRYRTSSHIYHFNPTRSPPLELFQKIPTLGATDMEAFALNGTTYLVASNEQDDEQGGDVESPVWRLRGAAPREVRGAKAGTAPVGEL